MEQDIQQHLFKVVVLGSAGVGKTSIVQQYCNGTFTTNYKATIGADFLMNELKLDERTRLKVHIWDMAGQDYNQDGLTRVYCRGARGAIIVHDITQSDNLSSISKWKTKLDQLMEQEYGTIPTILFLNKIDLEPGWLDGTYQVPISELGLVAFKNITNREHIELQCRELGIEKYFTTSASKNLNISDGFLSLYALILADPHETTHENRPPVVLTPSESSEEERGCC